MRENAKLREDMRKRGIPQWMVAAQLHVSENTLIRWLRYPLRGEREENIRQAIEAATRIKEADYRG